MKRTYCCYLYIDILPFLYYRYVDVILQLIDKTGEFISDDICYKQWRPTGGFEICSKYCTCSLFVYRLLEATFYVFDQPYTAAKAREYLDKPAIHETMVKTMIIQCFSIGISRYCIRFICLWLNVSFSDGGF